ncbi:porin [Shewanella marina]|uniref:porin n=1 Tax=Shewanella marina TaxID=487319 RepID=UPI00046FC142|nr:porin [Shewanella marina]
MKKTFISAAIASALSVASFAALADGPQVYGRIDVAATTTEASSTLQGSTSGKEIGHAGTYFENNFSHIGVKGTQNIAEGYDIVYQMEFGVDNMGADKGKSPFNSRNTFLGLKTNAGTVLVGRNDPVFKQVEGSVDAFGNTNADIDRLVAGQGRVADGVWYYSPKIADLVTVNATYLMKDNQAGADNSAKHNQYAVSATLGDSKLKAHNYYVAASYNKAINNIDAYRGVAQVKLGQLTLGALAQNSESVVNTLEGDTYFVSAKYNLNGVNLKLQYGYDESGLGSYFKNLTGMSATSLDTKAVSDVKINNITAGADYRLSKSTLVYGQYAHYEGDYKNAGLKMDLKQDSVLSVGVRYDF